MKLEALSGRRIGLLGLGREGAVTLDVLLERLPGCQVEVLVEGEAVEAPVPVRAGRFDEHLLDFDLLIRSPGVPVLHPALEEFRRHGRPIINPTSIWLAERPDVKVIAVTGSKGKSTTSAMLAHVLRNAGQAPLLAGNIGIPVLGHLDTRATLAVLELSSYQLSDLSGRLHIGLFTRLFPEHGDWHGGVEHYYASKLRMIDLLEGGPVLINARDPILLQATDQADHRVLCNASPFTCREAGRLVRSGRVLLDSQDWSLLGDHNLDNAALVIEAAALCGVDVEQAADALRSFQPLMHRLEVVRTDKGQRRWINDSIATTPHATLAALQAIGDESAVLIAGGYRRPADWSVVLDHCREKPLEALVVLPDSGQEVAECFAAVDGVCRGPVVVAKDMIEAVAAAARLAQSGQVVLFSPGAASFPHFAHFEERGSAFKNALAELK